MRSRGSSGGVEKLVRKENAKPQFCGFCGRFQVDCHINHTPPICIRGKFNNELWTVGELRRDTIVEEPCQGKPEPGLSGQPLKECGSTSLLRSNYNNSTSCRSNNSNSDSGVNIDSNCHIVAVIIGVVVK